MSIKSLEILGLRSFGETQTLYLSVPDGKSGSGFTVLVGPNNGGKSTRATTSEGETKTLETVATGRSEAKWDNQDGRPEATSFFVLPSRRTFTPFFSKGLQTRDQVFFLEDGVVLVEGQEDVVY